jgi:hypothetical protein
VAVRSAQVYYHWFHILWWHSNGFGLSFWLRFTDWVLAVLLKTFSFWSLNLSENINS